MALELPPGPLIVVAESFSGPLAVALAERVRVAALIFCNSFVRAPRARALKWITFPILFRLPPPRFLLRRYMLGPTADDELVREVAAVVGSVPSEILVSRIREVLAVDEGSAFARCDAPVLYIRGTEDRLVPESASQHMAALRPINTARVPGPHLLLQANPMEAWQSILAFLDALPPD